MALTYFKALNEDAKRQYVSDVLNRCCEAWGVERIIDIKDNNIQALGFNSSTIGMWVSRPTMPWDFILTTSMKCGVSMDYLFFNANKAINVNDTEKLTIPISNALHDCAEFGVIDHAHLELIITRIKKTLNEETILTSKKLA